MVKGRQIDIFLPKSVYLLLRRIITATGLEIVEAQAGSSHMRSHVIVLFPEITQAQRWESFELEFCNQLF